MQTKIHNGGQVKKIRNFLLTDVKIINKYLLVMIILVILSCVGLTSYALFSYEVEQEGNIKIVYSDLKGPVCVIDGPETSEIGANSNANYTMNCIDNFGVVDTTLTSDNFIVTGDITISNIEKEQIDDGYKYIIEITSGEISTIGNVKLKENVIQDINGNYNKESNVSDNIIVVTFPNEPTEYILINTYTTSQTWTAPEDGYFQIEVFGASGNGGNAYGGYAIVPAAGGGGGGGGYANSRVIMKKGETISLTIGSSGLTSSAIVSSSLDTYDTIQVKSGGVGGSPTEGGYTGGSGGYGGIASGGNYKNLNGLAGKSGTTTYVSTNYWEATGGAGGEAGYTGGNVGGKGGSGYRNLNEGAGYSGSAGSSGFIKIYRGNTNTTN